MIEVIPDGEPLDWLKKQHLIQNGMGTVAGVLLFCDEPQVYLPKSTIKIYRYKNTDSEGTRETLDFDPKSIEGCLYKQIFDAVDCVKSITESIPIVGSRGLEKIDYPPVAIHEIITNAVIHRDYSYQDDIHVRIFDNRIEVESPGLLPAHVTEKNILSERFSRNPKLVRLINKFKNPPNKDVGECLNASFQAMRNLKLKEPIIKQKENSVIVTLKHEKLASYEEIIVNYLLDHDEITNSKARDLCFLGDANQMKRVFQKMMKSGLIEKIPDRPQVKTAYRKGAEFPKD